MNHTAIKSRGGVTLIIFFFPGRRYGCDLEEEGVTSSRQRCFKVKVAIEVSATCACMKDGKVCDKFSLFSAVVPTERWREK